MVFRSKTCFTAKTLTGDPISLSFVLLELCTLLTGRTFYFQTIYDFDYGPLSQAFVIFILFALSNEIKNRIAMRPVENYPLYNEE